MKEEGHYTIKRVDSLPKKGNGNYIYIIKEDPLGICYRWLSNGSYEEVKISASSTNTPNLQAGTNITIDNTDPLNPIISAAGSGSSTLTTTVNINSSNLRANFPVPPTITIVPAPGFNKYLKIKEIYIHYNQGATSYDNGTSSIKLGGAVLNSSYNYGQETLPGNVTVSRIAIVGEVLIIQTNSALTFQTTVGNLQGDGNIDIIVEYEIVDL